MSWAAELKLPALTDIDHALEQPLRHKVNIIMTDKTTRALKTCNDFLAVAKLPFELPEESDNELGWGTLTTDGIRCLALDLLRNAKPATNSYLGWFRFTQAGIAKLPARLTLETSDDDSAAVAKAEKKCKPWGKYERRLKLHPDGSDTGQVSGDGWAGRVALFGRGDLDGDGLEDLLIYRYAQVEGGTASDEALFVISQTTTKACPRVVKTLPKSLGVGTQP